MALAPENKDFQLNHWRMRFANPEAERAFNLSWIRGTTGITRIWSTAGILFYVLFSILVAYTIPAEANGPLWLRIFVVLPILVLAQAPIFWIARTVASRRRSTCPDYSAWLAISYLTSSIAAYGCALLHFVATEAPFNQVYLYEMGVVFIFCQHYFRIRFHLVALFTLVSTLAASTAFLMVPGLSYGPVDAGIMTVLAFAAVGLFSSYTREVFVRRNYASIQILRAEKERSERLAQEAREASQSKSRFLAMMSHELRTPLNAIIGFSDAMRQGVFGSIEQQKYREYLRDIHNSGGQLLYLVNQILDLTKAEEQQVEMHDESNHLADLVDGVARSFALQVEDANVRLTVDNRAPGFGLRADQRMLRQMLDNLISNALKFTGTGGKVTVTVRREDDGLLITVADTGIGMTEEDAQRALSLFEQVDSDLNRKYNGAGIGLPLTSKLVELHDGRLELASAPGEGTTVGLRFPAERVVDLSEIDLAPDDRAFALPDDPEHGRANVRSMQVGAPVS